MTKATLTKLLLTILIVDAIVVGAIVGATTKSPGLALLVGALAIVLPVAVVRFVAPLVNRIVGWEDLQRRYPCGDPAVFDSGAKIISMGVRHPMLNMNNCVQAKADESHLHLRLSFPFMKDGPGVSIPWEAVSEVAPASLGRIRLRVDGITLWVPRWVARGELALREAMERERTEGPPTDAEPAGTIDA